MTTPCRSERSKRPAAGADLDSAAVPTRKLQRSHREEAASTVGAKTFAVQAQPMRSSVFPNFGDAREKVTSGLDELAALDPMQLTAEQLLLLSATRRRLDSIIKHAETAQNTPEEQLLPKDLLLQVFGFLETSDLCPIALACRHFDAAAQDIARDRLISSFGEEFVSLETGSPLPLLLKMEKQVARVPEILCELKPTMEDEEEDECSDAAMNIIKKLESFHPIALAASIHLLPATLERLPGPKLTGLRNELFRVQPNVYDIEPLPNARDTLEVLARAAADEIRDGGRTDICAFCAWSVMGDMPPSIIGRHLAIMLTQLSGERRSCLHIGVSIVLEMLERLPASHLNQIDKQYNLNLKHRLEGFARLLTASYERNHREFIARILARMQAV